MGGVDIHMISLSSCVVFGDFFSFSCSMFDSVMNGFFFLIPYMYGVSEIWL